MPKSMQMFGSKRTKKRGAIFGVACPEIFLSQSTDEIHGTRQTI